MTTKQHTVFGVFIPQGWKMELVSISDPVDKWNKTVEIAQLAEKLGFDSIWVYDHFHNVPRPAHEAVFECWTTMAAISQRTTTIRLGQMVGCNLYREPSLLAKITSTLDVISGGRLDWGIGAGWYENECRGYGYDFPEPKVRIAMLRECVEIVRSMWTQEETNYSGKHYNLVRGNCDPKPLQKPHPPIWIGGGGEQLTLRVVARYADIQILVVVLKSSLANARFSKAIVLLLGEMSPKLERPGRQTYSFVAPKKRSRLQVH